MSRRNILRFGSLTDLADALEENELSLDELRPVILNLIERISFLEGHAAGLNERVTHIAERWTPGAVKVR